MKVVWGFLTLCAILQTGKSLDCYECFGSPVNCKETVRTCYKHQTSCVSRGYTYISGEKTVDQMMKGCSQGLICNESAYVMQGNEAMYTSSICCSSNLCNTGLYYSKVRVSQLKCYTCQGDVASCSAGNLPNLTCAGVQDRCVDVTTVTIKGGSRTENVLTGCGTGNFCNRTLNSNTGNVSIYSNIQCCGSDYCNTARSTVNVDPIPNGLQCFACTETGQGECSDGNIQQVNCTGRMTRCMDVLSFPVGRTLLRGCCSEQVCLGLSATLSVSSSQKQYCCTGNLCNNGMVASYFTSSARSMVPQYRILPLWLATLITAVMSCAL